MSAPSNQRYFAVEVVRKLRAAGHTALFAGGCVRDSLLGREAKDFDVATTARPEEVQKLFGYQRTLAVGASFGVIMVLGPREAGSVEVATFRTEGPYNDGRRPTSVAFCTPEDDARRRDFTINGMFFDPVEEQLLDFVGGEADLIAKTVRAIGDPRERVREDKLRMLRAVRFAATLEFSLDPKTATAIREMASELVVVSAERIAQEFKKMLVDTHRRRAMELTEEVGLIRIIFPELDPDQKRSLWNVTLRRLSLLKSPRFELALAGLLMPLFEEPTVTAICRRLKLSNDETDRVAWLVTHQADLNDPQRLSLAALKRTLANPNASDLIQLLQADRIANSTSLDPIIFCQSFLEQTPREVLDPQLLITGDDLIALGFKPSPRFKSVLHTIRDAQLNLQIHSREDALAMVHAEWNK